MLVAVLGASPNPARYSNKAIKSLRTHGHEVLPVNPAHKRIEGLETVPSLASLSPEQRDALDTVTVYVGPHHIEPLIADLVAAKPKRIIANPGAESPALAAAARDAGIRYVEACTLVMLATGQFA